MSLLIDALRKAEQARRDGEFPPPAPAPEANGELHLAPLEGGPASEPPASLMPPLAGGDTYLEEAFTGRPRPPEPEQGADRAAARNLFEVKQAPPRRLFYPVVGGLTTVAVIALGAYLWWELQPRGLNTALPSAGMNPTRPPPPPSPFPSSPPTPTAAPAAPALASAPPVPAGPTPTPREETVAAPTRGSFTPPPRETPVTSGLGPIRRDGASPDRLPEALDQAYAAYNAGDLTRAAGLYGQVLRDDRHNRDALDGLGAIALRRGREAEAEGWFQRALAGDPNDPVALAGLANLRGRSQPEQGETRMKNLVAAQPEAAPAHFALGNALAAQGRWPEAQQAYFDAHTLDPGNPDYLFNLAVSLDRLHQSSLASRYYGQALTAAGQRAASFERGQAEARLQALHEAR